MMGKLMFLCFFSMVALFSNTLNVTVSILPQKYFVQKIAKDKINVNVMVKSGFSPATYEPKTTQMKLLTDSQAYFSIGVPFEKVWLNKFKNINKNMLIVETDKNINKIRMEEHTNHHHEKDKDVHNDEDTLDPHIWLDPMLVKIQAKNIYEALIKIDIQNKTFYLMNYNSFMKELDILDETIKTLLSPLNKKSFIVFHPSWGYFARAYNLKQITIEKEGKSPKVKEIIKVIKKSKKEDIKIVFVSPQFSKKVANSIAKSINGTTFVIDPLSYDYETNLIKTAESLLHSYQ